MRSIEHNHSSCSLIPRNGRLHFYGVREAGAISARSFKPNWLEESRPSLRYRAAELPRIRGRAHHAVIDRDDLHRGRVLFHHVDDFTAPRQIFEQVFGSAGFEQ